KQQVIEGDRRPVADQYVAGQQDTFRIRVARSGELNHAREPGRRAIAAVEVAADQERRIALSHECGELREELGFRVAERIDAASLLVLGPGGREQDDPGRVADAELLAQARA